MTDRFAFPSPDEPLLIPAPAPMDYISRLDQIAQRKTSRPQLAEDVRAGRLPGVSHASDFFQRAAPTPASARKDLLQSLDNTVLHQGAAGHVHLRRVELRPGLDGAQLHALGPIPATVTNPIPVEFLGDLSREVAQSPLTNLSPEEIGFIDTETTGLAGGAGTIAFLIGVGWWENRPAPEGWTFVLEQYLVDDFPHEAEQMRLLAERLARFRVLVSYNGRSFDIPLLRSRGIMNRLPPKLFRQAQVDLLHPARRLWRDRLGAANLKVVEANVLGIDRGPDVDGAEIPSLFFDLARDGTVGRIPLVVRHNAQDIATLAGLLHRVGAVLAGQPGVLGHWSEFAGLAKWRESLGRLEEAARAWTHAIELTGHNEDAERELMGRLARCHKRLRQWEGAVEAWSELRRRPFGVSAVAWCELAKYHEHVAREPEAALRIVRECLARVAVERDLAAVTGRPQTREALGLAADMARRERRLLNRLTKRGNRN